MAVESHCFIFSSLTFHQPSLSCGRCEAGHAGNHRAKERSWRYNGRTRWTQGSGEQKNRDHPFLQDVCTGNKAVPLLITAFKCLLRWAAFSNGTKTSAGRWYSWTATRRMCSRWIMTPFVTLLEQEIADLSSVSTFNSSWCVFLHAIQPECFMSVRLYNKMLEFLFVHLCSYMTSHLSRKQNNEFILQKFISKWCQLMALKQS